MAKGNLFQGMARGKVGDVVFYRMNGVQMSRVRNRAPKNPRSNEQLYQRAVIASVMKAYSAGKEIFDHSFQGYTVGEGCMRRFNSVNSRILRNELAEDVNTGKTGIECVGRFVAPKSLFPAAIIGLQVSEGTLTNDLFVPSLANGQQYYEFKIAGNAEMLDMKVNDYLNSIGTYAGDIYTVVQFATDLNEVVFNPDWAPNDEARQFGTYFQWCRFIVKSGISEDLALSQAKYQDVFDIELGGYKNTFNTAQDFRPGNAVLVEFPSTNWTRTTAIIRSRRDIDLRSTEYMVPTNKLTWGITSQYVLAAWQEMVEKIGNSDLILEGAEEGPALQPMSNPIISAPVDEAPVPTMARHRGTSNNKK